MPLYCCCICFHERLQELRCYTWVAHLRWLHLLGAENVCELGKVHTTWQNCTTEHSVNWTLWNIKNTSFWPSAKVKLFFRTWWNWTLLNSQFIIFWRLWHTLLLRHLDLVNSTETQNGPPRCERPPVWVLGLLRYGETHNGRTISITSLYALSRLSWSDRDWCRHRQLPDWCRTESVKKLTNCHKTPQMDVNYRQMWAFGLHE